MNEQLRLAKSSSPTSPARKRSKVSEIFKTPNSSANYNAETSTSTNGGPSSSNGGPSSHSTSFSSSSFSSSSKKIPSRDENNNDPNSSRTAPTVGKGKGKKGASAFIKGSPTQQQIWKTQDKIETIEGYLSMNPVFLFK